MKLKSLKTHATTENVYKQQQQQTPTTTAVIFPGTKRQSLEAKIIFASLIYIYIQLKRKHMPHLSNKKKRGEIIGACQVGGIGRGWQTMPKV